MRERPILFRGEMVRAILEGRKGQTRRTRGLDRINEDADGWELVNVTSYAMAQFRHKRTGEAVDVRCQLGQPGDRLWVKETHGYITSAGVRTVYRADGEPRDRFSGDAIEGMKWRPSIFMRRADSRITLEVTGVRVERLQDISEEDASSEGVEMPSNGYWLDYRKNNGIPQLTAKDSFWSLWCSINGDESWVANPWVWVIEFKRIAAQERAA